MKTSTTNGSCKLGPNAVCHWCGKEFRASPFFLRIGKGKYCSRVCSDQGRRKRVKRICPVCGREFGVLQSTVKNGHGKYCSDQCWKAHCEKERFRLHCAYCGVEINTIKSDVEGGRRFCSKECANSAKVTRVGRVCEVCGKEFEVNRFRFEQGYGKYCGIGCRTVGLTKRIRRVCQECGSEFEAPRYKVDCDEAKYCNPQVLEEYKRVCLS